MENKKVWADGDILYLDAEFNGIQPQAIAFDDNIISVTTYKNSCLVQTEKETFAVLNTHDMYNVRVDKNINSLSAIVALEDAKERPNMERIQKIEELIKQRAGSKLFCCKVDDIEHLLAENKRQKSALKCIVKEKYHPQASYIAQQALKEE